MIYKKYAIGCYNPNGTRKNAPQSRFYTKFCAKAVIKNKKRSYIRKYKHNRIYRGYWTKRELAKRVLWMRILIAAFIAIGIIQAFLTTTNSLAINGEAVSGTYETSSFVEPQGAGEDILPPSQEVRAVKIETIEQQIRRIAKEHNFKWIDYLVKLAYCESRFDPNAIGDNGASRGLYQIHRGYHPTITDEQAFDIRWSTIWTMEQINAGRQNLWSCNKIILKK